MLVARCQQMELSYMYILNKGIFHNGTHVPSRLTKYEGLYISLHTHTHIRRFQAPHTVQYVQHGVSSGTRLQGTVVDE